VKPTERVGWAALRALGRVRAKIAFHAWHDQWFIAYGTCSAARPDTCDFDRFQRLSPPWDRFWADPFPISSGDRRYIFFEDFSFELGRGRIAVVTVDRDGLASDPRTVLDRPYHLSYPFVFEWGGEHFMVPESRESGRLELYRAEEFPDRWASVAVLLDGVAAADATFLDWHGLWWMFVNISPDGRLENDRVHLYSARSPLGPWTEHARSPLPLDPALSRPAGGFIVHGDALYRPSQSGIVRYGHQIRLNRVVRLDLDDYVEEPVSEIAPTWSPRLRGTHTLNRAEDLVCIDGYRRRFRPPRVLSWRVRTLVRRARSRVAAAGTRTPQGPE
jgi:hypothetical protein